MKFKTTGIKEHMMKGEITNVRKSDILKFIFNQSAILSFYHFWELRIYETYYAYIKKNWKQTSKKYDEKCCIKRKKKGICYVRKEVRSTIFREFITYCF